LWLNDGFFLDQTAWENQSPNFWWAFWTCIMGVFDVGLNTYVDEARD
jgi:hypothetical protein